MGESIAKFKPSHGLETVGVMLRRENGVAADFIPRMLLWSALRVMGRGIQFTITHFVPGIRVLAVGMVRCGEDHMVSKFKSRKGVGAFRVMKSVEKFRHKVPDRRRMN